VDGLASWSIDGIENDQEVGLIRAGWKMQDWKLKDCKLVTEAATYGIKAYNAGA